MSNTDHVIHEAEDIQPQEMAGEHITYPPDVFGTQALDTYLALRDANPWLPEPNKVTAGDSITLNFGVNQMSTLSLTVYIALPEVIQHDGSQA